MVEESAVTEQEPVKRKMKEWKLLKKKVTEWIWGKDTSLGNLVRDCVTREVWKTWITGNKKTRVFRNGKSSCWQLLASLFSKMSGLAVMASTRNSRAWFVDYAFLEWDSFHAQNLGSHSAQWLCACIRLCWTKDRDHTLSSDWTNA